jgi:branched-chain amino acid transport system ATP-binding protein
MSAGAAMLEASALSLRAGGAARNRLLFSGLDMRVAAGERWVVVGPNGAGKSSLLSAIAGIVRPAGGTISIGGSPLAGTPLSDVVRRGVALVPEGRNIFGSLTVMENLRLGATVRRDEGVASDIEATFTNFPILGERRDQPAGLLSGGEQQMLAIARAMLSRPRLLMLDEPSLGLAPTIVDRVYGLLRSIRAQGVALLVVEQNASRAFALADRACVMNRGAFTLAGVPAEIEGHHAFDAAYFGVSMTTEGAAS